MKILMLDIDGILFTYGNYNFSPSACKNLSTLLEKVPDLKIVISSSWRHLGLDYVKNTLNAHGIDASRVIGITGDESGTDKNRRGLQCQAWLDRNPEIKSFVCLDDESDFANMMDHLVQCNPYVGLTSADVDKAIKILNK